MDFLLQFAEDFLVPYNLLLSDLDNYIYDN